MSNLKLSTVTWVHPALGGEICTQAKYVRIEPGVLHGIVGFWLHPRTGQLAFKPAHEVVEVRFNVVAEAPVKPTEPPQALPVAAVASVESEPSAPPPMRRRGRPPKAKQG